MFNTYDIFGVIVIIVISIFLGTCVLPKIFSKKTTAAKENFFHKGERAGQVYSGLEFNNLHKGERFYKIMNYNECHHGFQYKDGLNIDTVAFHPFGSCKGGGLYFANEKHIANYINYGVSVRRVTIPNDARVYVDINKYKADKIILKKKVPLGDSHLWNNAEFCKTALFLCGTKKCIELVKNPSNLFCKLAIERDPSSIRWFEFRTDKLWEMAIREDYSTLALMEPQTEKMCRFAIELNPYNIKYVENKTPSLKKLARKIIDKRQSSLTKN